jgi:hypothetical protein
MLIPVQHKPLARRLQDSHILQIAAQCFLVQEVYGVRPAYELLVMAVGVQERVEFSPALDQREHRHAQLAGHILEPAHGRAHVAFAPVALLIA